MLRKMGRDGGRGSRWTEMMKMTGATIVDSFDGDGNVIDGYGDGYVLGRR